MVGCGAKDQAQIKGQELVVGVGRDFYSGSDSSNFLHGSTGVWESLTYLNENLEPVPQLAEKTRAWTRPGLENDQQLPGQVIQY